MLDMAESNYTQWRCFLNCALSKFGLEDHVLNPLLPAQQNADWVQNDHSIVNWIYTTIIKPVFDIVYRLRASAFRIWTDIESIFRDNELQRAVYIEAEFRSLVQGRDVGQPISESSQVLNLLRGLSTKYRHHKPIITAKFPPHTFMSARLYLMLEELHDEQDAKQEAA